MEAARSIPVTVKVIAALYLLTSLFCLFAAATFFITQNEYGILSPFAEYGTAGAAVALGCSLVAYMLSRGLRAGKSWARKAAIVIAILSIAASFYYDPTLSKSLVFQLVVNLTIIGYLLFSRQVRAAF